MKTPTPEQLEEAREKFPPIWTIYANPSDYPGKHVVRQWWGEHPDPHVVVVDSLEHARAVVKGWGGCFCLNREPADDPTIHESWI